MQASKVLAIFAVYLTLASAQPCKFNVPFSSEIVNKRYTALNFCSKWFESSEVEIFPQTFEYTPFHLVRVFTNRCFEKYVFHLRRGRLDPFITYLPALDPPRLLNNTESAKYCRQKQKMLKKKYFPAGKTRNMFKTAVRTMVKGSLVIRDFGCKIGPNGFSFQVPGRAFNNVDVEGVVTYLLSVGYRYNFCAESA